MWGLIEMSSFVDAYHQSQIEGLETLILSNTTPCKMAAGIPPKLCAGSESLRVLLKSPEWSGTEARQREQQ